VLSLSVEKAEAEGAENRHQHMITLPVAVGTIMVMDIVFSIDSVITAVGLANHLIIMIIAVITAVILMMVFIDAISDFINDHVEMKILALFFIAAIGVLLVLDGLGINSGVEVLDMHMEKLMVYFAMVFCLIIELFQMSYNARLRDFVKEQHIEQLERVVMGYPADPSNAVDDDLSDDEDNKRGVRPY
jgi:predicted tellurium resistance membrane protein TerC